MKQLCRCPGCRIFGTPARWVDVELGITGISAGFMDSLPHKEWEEVMARPPYEPDGPANKIRQEREDKASDFLADVAQRNARMREKAQTFDENNLADVARRNAPDNNPKTAVGLKKTPYHFIPPAALFFLGLACENGGQKYGLMNWRENSVSASVYYDAMQRHLLAWWDGEDEAPDSGIHHLGHVMACCAILLDAMTNDGFNDNRPRLRGAFDILSEDDARQRATAKAGPIGQAGVATSPIGGVASG